MYEAKNENSSVSMASFVICKQSWRGWWELISGPCLKSWDRKDVSELSLFLEHNKKAVGGDF